MAAYAEYKFLYPPRPERAIFGIQIPWIEQRGHVVQYKKNGTCNVVAVSPDREVIARQRDGANHIMWSPSPHTSEPFHDLPGGWYVFVAELLHSKVPGIRDINYINDILVADSQHLTGMTYKDRQILLMKLFNAERLPVASSGSHWIIDQHTWLARNHFQNFAEMFAKLSAPEDEGLVFKAPNAQLAPIIGPKSNSNWLCKIRRPHENYSA